MGRPRKNRPADEYDPVENPHPYLGEKERFLIGWPGYRIRPEKSGLAPVETQAELGHMQGGDAPLAADRPVQNAQPRLPDVDDLRRVLVVLAAAPADRSLLEREV